MYKKIATASKWASKNLCNIIYFAVDGTTIPMASYMKAILTIKLLYKSKILKSSINCFPIGK